MSLDLLGDVNWLGVVVATIAYFALGAVWYLPQTFGSVWMRSMGWEPRPDERPRPAIYAAPIVTSLVAVTAVAMIAEAAGADGLGDGLVLWLVVGVGIAASLFFVTAIFEPTKPQPMTWFAITAGYHLVGLLIASLLLSLW